MYVVIYLHCFFLQWCAQILCNIVIWHNLKAEVSKAASKLSLRWACFGNNCFQGHKLTLNLKEIDNFKRLKHNFVPMLHNDEKKYNISTNFLSS